MNSDSDDQSVKSQDSKKTQWMKKRKALRISEPLLNVKPPPTNKQFTIDDLNQKIDRIFSKINCDCSKETSVDIWLFTISLLLYCKTAPDKIEISKNFVSKLLAKTQNDFMPLPGDFQENKMIINDLTLDYWNNIKDKLEMQPFCEVHYEPKQVLIDSTEDKFPVFNQLIDVRQSKARETVDRMFETMSIKLESNDVELGKVKSQVDYCFKTKNFEELLVPEKPQRIRSCLRFGKPSIAEVNRLLKLKYPDKTPHTSQEKVWGEKCTLIYDIIGCYCHIHKKMHAGNHQFVSWSGRNIRYKCHHKERDQTTLDFVNLTE